MHAVFLRCCGGDGGAARGSNRTNIEFDSEINCAGGIEPRLIGEAEDERDGGSGDEVD